MKAKYILNNCAYGWGSWGDEMILDGALNVLGREDCVVASTDPAETREMHGVRAVIWDQWFHVEAETLCVAGGGWGYKPHCYSVATATQIALNKGMKVWIDAAGLSPHYGEWWKTDQVEPLRRADRFTVRDTMSRQVAAEMGIDAELVDDLALAMGVEDWPLPSGKWLGVNLTNDDGAIARMIPLLAALQEEGWTLLGLPTICHKNAPRLDGHEALRKASETLRHPIVNVRGPWHGDSVGPRRLAGLASHCKAVLSMHRHGAYLAKRVGVPAFLFDWPDDFGKPRRLEPVAEGWPPEHYCDLERDHPEEWSGLILATAEREDATDSG